MAEDHKFILLQNADGVKLFPRIDLGNTNDTLLPQAKVNGLVDALAAKGDKSVVDGLVSVTNGYTGDSAIKNAIDAKLATADFNSTIANYSTTVEMNAAIAASKHLKKEIVDSIDKMTEVDVIYLLAKAETDPGYVAGENIYDEYIVISGKAEKIGNTKVDLKDYSTTTQMDTAISSAVATAKTEITGGSTETIATLASGKADKSTTLAGYNIGDAYTKTEIDGFLGENGIAGELSELEEEINGKASQDEFNDLEGRVTATENVANDASDAVKTKAELSYVDGEFKTAISGEIDADVKAAKDAIDEYTINSKKISDNPTLSGNDIALGDYGVADSALSFTAATTVTDAFEAIDTQFKNLVGGGEGGEGGEGGLNLTGINIRLTAAEGDIDDIEAALEGLLTAGAVQSALDLKANKADVDAIIGENGSLTQTVALKANASDVDAKIGDEGTITKAVAANTANFDNYYTKTAADTTFVKAVDGLNAVYFVEL